MRVAVFSTKPHDRSSMDTANDGRHELSYFDTRLTPDTMALAEGHDAVCAFVNDRLGAGVISALAERGVRLVTLRSTGFNHIDLGAADEHGLTVARVPAYSPHAVAEHALALVLTLNRKSNRAYNRVREGVLGGLMGFDLCGKTVGVVGTGKIGAVFARIMNGIGCRVLAADPHPNDDVETFAEYVPQEQLFQESDIISLHCPLTAGTYHLIGEEALGQMKEGVMLVNTSRGGLIDTEAVIGGLKSGRVGHLGLDVYEEEGDLFFKDLSGHVIQDDVFSRLLTFPNVVVTGHGAFTEEAVQGIAEATIGNATTFETGEGALHEVTAKMTA